MFNKKRKSVCVQGLGFVGSTMSIVIASAVNKANKKIYNVYGLERDNIAGNEIVQKINKGIFPFKTSDKKLIKSLKNSIYENYIATSDIKILSKVDVVICDVNLDLIGSAKNPKVNFNQIRPAIESIGKFIKEDALIIFESTVPPGTSKNIIIPILKSEFKKRGLDQNKLNYTYSFERVMPGKNYFDSIKSFWRVYSSSNLVAKRKSAIFFKKILNVNKYPLTYLDTFESCELTKILENTYRAVNIALIDEWSKYAKFLGIDLFDVTKAIRLRPTHSNIMNPGFGVGGYCLTKDPLFAKVAQKTFYKKYKGSFPFSELAIKTNRLMPNNTFNILISILKKQKIKKVCILGLTYKSGVEDTRDSPALELIKKIKSQATKVFVYDPVVSKFYSKTFTLINKLPSTDEIKIFVFTTQHNEYKRINMKDWIKNNKIIIIDSNNVLSKKQRDYIDNTNSELISIGRG